MYEGRSDEMSAQNNEKYYQYEGQQFEPYTTIIGQSGMPLSIPYGLFQYAKYQEDPRNAKVKDSLRRGKWTDEEVKLTDRIIETFNAGSLELDPETAGGVTLRSYLSEKLGCDPMRITKKYTGASCLGKRVYHSANTKAPREVVEAVKIELALLEVKFREKLEKNSRDRLGLEADVDKHLRNQVVSTPSIDAMMMQGSSGCRANPKNGYWPLPETSMQANMPPQSSSSSSVPTSNRPHFIALPASYQAKMDNAVSPMGRGFVESSSKEARKSKAECSLEAFNPNEVSTVTVERADVSGNCDRISPSSGSADHITASAQRSRKKVPSRFPYSRYYDPTTPKDNAKEGFELSASSYYYAPSAQEVEASEMQQAKQQQNHMLLLLQQQQQQKQQYYLSLEKSSDLPFIPKNANLTHCVPTLANIGGVKRAADKSELSSNASKTKMHKIENNRSLNDLPFAAFLKSGNNIHGGSGGYQGQGHGQGLVITVPVVSDMSTNGNSNDDCSSGSGGGSPDAAGSDGIGSGSTASGANSDEGEGETSDDSSKKSKNNNESSQSSFSFRNKEYNKVSNHDFKASKEPYNSGGNYEYKTFPSTLNSDSFSNGKNKCLDKEGLRSETHVAENSLTECSSSYIKEKNVPQSTDHNEALLSMMNFFSHCHKVESEK